MNNQLSLVANYGALPPAVLPHPARLTFFDILPIGLTCLCLIVAFITFLIHKRNPKISMFIPSSMLIISAILAFLVLVPLPLKKICDFSSVNNSITNCESIYLTGWKRFVEITTSTDKRSIIPRRRGGIFPMGTIN